jgi:hypothetical protein
VNRRIGLKHLPAGISQALQQKGDGVLQAQRRRDDLSKFQSDSNYDQAFS